MPLTLSLPAVGAAGPGWAQSLLDALGDLQDFVNGLETTIGTGGGGTGPLPDSVLQIVVKDEATGTWGTGPAADDESTWVWFGTLDAEGNPPPGARSWDVLWIRR
jgi:hypothetical protein